MESAMGVKPDWLRKTIRGGDDGREVEELVRDLGLNTVCREASCPNISECFGRGVATFMILGANCTRGCGFCGVSRGAPEPEDDGEPSRVGEAVRRLGLGYVVVTSVTRDDLPDGGAASFAKTVRAIRELSPGTKIETLIPDFGGSAEALDTVIKAAPDVISHNMETVRALYGKVRPQADYDRSLDVLRRVSSSGGSIKSKSGIMLGVGETDAQLRELFIELADAGCSILTIGQYLRPSPENIPVEAYIEPKVFDELAGVAKESGLELVTAGPFVRSSYHAEEAIAMGEK